MNFLLDHNLSPLLARALNELSRGSGHEVAALRDRFPDNPPDETWLRALGQEGGWAVVTCDASIRRNPGELAAWREAKLTTFFLAKGWSSLQHWAKAAKLVQIWPTIEQSAVSVRAGAAYLVHVKGRLEVLQTL
jgi:hypothetical protein